jgi:histidinol-phosphatase
VDAVTTRWDLVFLNHLADVAEEIAQPHLKSAAMAVEMKSDGSPVTDADREIENALRSRIRQEHPDDAFLGEETGAHGQSHRRWIIDAIDGTASFLAGEPEWSTLIALEMDGRVSCGMVSAPALRRRWWATREHGSWTSAAPAADAGRPTAITIGGASQLHDAKIGIWPPPSRLSEADRAVAATLAASAGHTRPTLDWTAAHPSDHRLRKPSSGSGTSHGALLVAMGHLDAFLLLGVGPWDIAALVPIIEEAGGKVSTSPRSPTATSQSALFSNAALHKQILDLTSGTDRRIGGS